MRLLGPEVDIVSDGGGPAAAAPAAAAAVGAGGGGGGFWACAEGGGEGASSGAEGGGGGFLDQVHRAVLQISVILLEAQKVYGNTVSRRNNPKAFSK